MTGIARSKVEGFSSECTCTVKPVVNARAAMFFCLMSFQLLLWTLQNNENAGGLPASHELM